MALVLVCWWAAVCAVPSPAAFVGERLDGGIVAGVTIEEHNYNAMTIAVRSPTAATLKLTDVDHPLRWLCQEAVEDGRRVEQAIEFFGGDRLPCRVVEHRDDGPDGPLVAIGPHLVVEPLLSLDVPGRTDRPRLRVRLDLVRRIVRQPTTGDRYRPGTLFCLDGREVRFRALLWNTTGVILLTDEETREVPLEQIAELHLPARDPWQAYVAILTRICPSATSRLVRLETPEGCVVTDALPAAVGMYLGGPEHRGWLQGFTPAWSLDPLWLAIRAQSVRSWRWYAPHELPLTMLEPSGVMEKSLLEGSWGWATDRNVLGGPLRGGGRRGGWGLGTLAHAELEYPLASFVRGFRSRVAIDDAVVRGGHARAIVRRGDADAAAVWRSDPLEGGGVVADTGLLPLPAATTGDSLVLVSHRASPGEPARDPLNVRDLVDWLEPTLHLDGDGLCDAVAAALPATIDAWRGWEVSLGDRGRVVVERSRDVQPPFDEQRPRLRRLVIARGGRLVVSRRLQVTSDRPWLCVAVGRIDTPQSPGGPSAIEVRVDGESLARWDVPARPGSRPVGPAEVSPRLVRLDRYVDHEVLIEVEHLPGDDRGLVEWQLLDLVATADFGPWSAAEVVAARSSAGSTMTIGGDGLVTVKGDPVPAQDTFTIEADTQLTDISGFRLELVPTSDDPRGAARHPKGRFFLGDVRVTAAPLHEPGRAEPVEIAAALADEWSPGTSPSNVIDEQAETGWSALPTTEPHALVLTAARPVGHPGGTRLSFTLAHGTREQQSLGRFRLSLTQARPPLLVPRRPVIVEPPASTRGASP